MHLSVKTSLRSTLTPFLRASAYLRSAVFFPSTRSHPGNVGQEETAAVIAEGACRVLSQAPPIVRLFLSRYHERLSADQRLPMPVFYRDDVRVLYVHVPKTGGTSLERFFRGNNFKMAYFDAGASIAQVRWCSPQHMHAEMLKTIFKIEKFDFVFMTVRHPFSRLISEYKMRHAKKPHRREVNAWITEFLDRYGNNHYILDNHIRPQVEFLVPHCDVHRMEDGYDAKFARTLSERLSLKLDCEEVGHFQRGTDTDVESLNKDVAARVRDFYREDFAAFGYDDVGSPCP
jgi:hypothetical protein